MEEYSWTGVNDTILEFSGQNPQKPSTLSHAKYEAIKTATTVGQAKQLGASAWELAQWFKKDAMRISGRILKIP